MSRAGSTEDTELGAPCPGMSSGRASSPPRTRAFCKLVKGALDEKYTFTCTVTARTSWVCGSPPPIPARVVSRNLLSRPCDTWLAFPAWSRSPTGTQLPGELSEVWVSQSPRTRAGIGLGTSPPPPGAQRAARPGHPQKQQPPDKVWTGSRLASGSVRDGSPVQTRPATTHLPCRAQQSWGERAHLLFSYRRPDLQASQAAVCTHLAAHARVHGGCHFTQDGLPRATDAQRPSPGSSLRLGGTPRLHRTAPDTVGTTAPAIPGRWPGLHTPTPLVLLRAPHRWCRNEPQQTPGSQRQKPAPGDKRGFRHTWWLHGDSHA